MAASPSLDTQRGPFGGIVEPLPPSQRELPKSVGWVIGVGWKSIGGFRGAVSRNERQRTLKGLWIEHHSLVKLSERSGLTRNDLRLKRLGR